MKCKARVIAFYLPQFHPIPENDRFWGKGFTEWTNVGNAKPLFRNHCQPRVPADLGYYDLRMPEIREAQAKLAMEAGIEGFMYWHYWFGNGQLVLERPFKEVLKSGKPDFPFCLGWANHSWTNRTWISNKTGKSGFKTIIEQKYLGEKDFIEHFYYCLPAFLDNRYIKINNKPVFYIFNPFGIENWDQFVNTWTEHAFKNKLEGIHFVGSNRDKSQNTEEVLNRDGISGVSASGFEDAMIKASNLVNFKIKTIIHDRMNYDFGSIMKYSYSKIIKYQIPESVKKTNVYPVIIPQMDASPRRGKRAIILHGSTPVLFKNHLNEAVDMISHKDFEDRLIFLRSWNEWGEGNYIEPDLQFGHGYLDVLKECLFSE